VKPRTVAILGWSAVVGVIVGFWSGASLLVLALAS
jgi:hypothetical protein